MPTERIRVLLYCSEARGYRAPATLTLEQWEQTLIDFNGLCAYCQIRPFEVLEHFLPINRAGTTVRNCLPACNLCNRRKNNRQGHDLRVRFGRDTIERLQCYLSSRQETPFLDMAEVEERLGMMASSIRRLIQKGELYGYKWGRIWRFEEQDIRDYIQRQREKAEAEKTEPAA